MLSTMLFVICAVRQPLTHIEWLYSLTREGKEFKRHCNYVHTVAEDIIAKRKAQIVSGSLTD